MNTRIFRRNLFRLVAALSVLVFALPVSEGSAQSASQALNEYRTLQKRLDSLTEQHAREQGRLGKVETDINAEEGKIAALDNRISDTQSRFDARVREAYLAGPAQQLAAFWEAGSLREFSLRMQVLERQSSQDETLMLQMSKDRAEKQRRVNALERKRQEKADAVASLRSQKGSVGKAVAALEAVYQRLAQDERERASRLASSSRRSLGFSGSSSGRTISLQACPAAGPRSFSNDWGAPRGGGSRRHKGNDIFASQGSPAAAVVAGRITRTSSGGLGGLSIYLFGNDGNEYFYTHMSSFKATQGQSVAAGQTIATVGNTGNARGGAPHIHFEVHPGGGGAINPYFSLIRVC